MDELFDRILDEEDSVCQECDRALDFSEEFQSGLCEDCLQDKTSEEEDNE